MHFEGFCESGYIYILVVSNHQIIDLKKKDVATIKNSNSNQQQTSKNVIISVFILNGC